MNQYLGMTREEKIQMQRDAFAVHACYLTKKTAEEAAACLAMAPEEISVIYRLIEWDKIDFDSPFSE